jgi:integrase
MRAHHSYLYQVKGSQHFYFRVRWSYFGRLIDREIGGGHFVASLGTPDLNKALWLCRFILQKLSLYSIQYKDKGVNSHGATALWQTAFKIDMKRVYGALLQEGNQIQGSSFLSFLNSSEVVAAESSPKQLQSQQGLIMEQLQALYTLIEKSLPSATHDHLFIKNTDVKKARTAIQASKVSLSARVEKLGLERFVREFCGSKFREIGASARQQYTKSLNTLIDILGNDFPVTLLDYEQAQKVKNVVLGLPSGRKNTMGSEVALSIKTVNKYITNMLTFCDWLVKQRHVLSVNPFVGSLLKLESKHQLKRRPFELNEINAILAYQPRHKLEAAEFRDAAKWLPAIALFSGMRLNEIAAIRLRDVRYDEGIWFFDLSSYRLKTENATRLIPMHSRLIDLGLIKFVEQKKAEKELYLFPELYRKHKSESRDGVGISVGKWFNRTLLTGIGISKNDEKVSHLLIDFHCCRHTVASRFKFHGVPAYLAKQILGHELDDDITWGIYSGQVATKLAALKAVIEMLDY